MTLTITHCMFIVTQIPAKNIRNYTTPFGNCGQFHTDIRTNHNWHIPEPLAKSFHCTFHNMIISCMEHFDPRYWDKALEQGLPALYDNKPKFCGPVKNLYGLVLARGLVIKNHWFEQVFETAFNMAGIVVRLRRWLCWINLFKNFL